MEAIYTKKKKVDLLEFQKTLNSQFMDIFEAKNKAGFAEEITEQTSADLGLEISVAGLLFFVPLRILKTISMDNSYEDSILMQPWITGFNQLRGDIYTIMDFEKVIELLLGLPLTRSNRWGPEARIVYLKNEDAKLAFVLPQLKLGYTAELTSIFKFTGFNNNIAWDIAPEVVFDKFVRQNKMSAREWTLISSINAVVQLGAPVPSLQEYIQQQQAQAHIFEDNGVSANAPLKVEPLYFVEDVFLDPDGARPVFILNTNNLTNYLSLVTPY